jgi:hypothetical protein
LNYKTDGTGTHRGRLATTVRVFESRGLRYRAHRTRIAARIGIDHELQNKSGGPADAPFVGVVEVDQPIHPAPPA